MLVIILISITYTFLKDTRTRKTFLCKFFPKRQCFRFFIRTEQTLSDNEAEENVEIFSSMSYQNYPETIDETPRPMPEGFPTPSSRSVSAPVTPILSPAAAPVPLKRKNSSRDNFTLSKRQKAKDVEPSKDFYDAEIIEDLGDSYRIRVVSEGKSTFGVVFKDAGKESFMFFCF
jgi:hypothetical protein